MRSVNALQTSVLEDFKTSEKRFKDQGGDEAEVKAYISDFKQLKPKIQDNDKKDIDKWKTWDEFKVFVDELKTTKTKGQEKKEKKSQGAKLVVEDKYWRVYQITSHDAARLYGSGTKWCITEPDPHHWDNYTNDQENEFYFYISKRLTHSSPYYKIAMQVDKMNGQVTYWDALDRSHGHSENDFYNRSRHGNIPFNLPRIPEVEHMLHHKNIEKMEPQESMREGKSLEGRVIEKGDHYFIKAGSKTCKLKHQHEGPQLVGKHVSYELDSQGDAVVKKTLAELGENNWEPDAKDLYSYAQNVESLYNLMSNVSNKNDALYAAEEIINHYNLVNQKQPDRLYKGSEQDVADLIMQDVSETDEAMDLNAPIGVSGVEGFRLAKLGMAEAERFTDSDLQDMSGPALLQLIRDKKVTYPDVDKALEKQKRFQTLDWIGDQLSKDELKGASYSNKPTESTGAQATLAEADPSLQPPKRWFNKMAKRIKKTNPDYDKDQVKNTIGDIWYHKLSQAKKSEIRGREGKKLAPAAESVNEVSGIIVPKELEILHMLLMARGLDKDSPEFRDIQKNASHDVSFNKLTGNEAFKKALSAHPELFDKAAQESEISEESDEDLEAEYGPQDKWTDALFDDFDFKSALENKNVGVKDKADEAKLVELLSHGADEVDKILNEPDVLGIPIVGFDWKEEIEPFIKKGEAYFSDSWPVGEEDGGAVGAFPFSLDAALAHLKKNESGLDIAASTGGSEVFRRTESIDQWGVPLFEEKKLAPAPSVTGFDTWGLPLTEEANVAAVILKPGVDLDSEKLKDLGRKLNVKVSLKKGKDGNVIKVDTAHRSVLDHARNILGHDKVKDIVFGDKAVHENIEEDDDDAGRADPLKKKALAQFRQPDFSQANLSIGKSNAIGGDFYDLTLTLPVDVDFLKKDGMGELVSAAHDFIGKKMDMWLGTPTVGGQDARAKGGMKTIRVMWHIDDPILAYSMGLDMEAYGGSPVVSPEEMKKRLDYAEKSMSDATAWKENAIKELDAQTSDEAQRNQIWKEKYLPTWSKMLDAMKEKGLNYSLAKRR